MTAVSLSAARECLALLATAALAACGEREANTQNSPGAADVPAADAPASQTACLPAADVSAAVQLEVREFPAGSQTSGENQMCAYQAVDVASGVVLSLSRMGSAAEAETIFNDMRESARLMLGTAYELQPAEVGERGYAYASGSKAEAAAVAGGRLYRAEITATGSGVDLSGKRDGLVALIRRQIAP